LLENKEDTDSLMENSKNKKYNIWQLVLLAVAIFLFRISYVDLYENLQGTYGVSLADYIKKISLDFPSIIAIFSLSILFVYFINKKFEYGSVPIRRLLLTFIGILIISTAVTSISARDIIFSSNKVTLYELWSYLAITMLAAVILVSIVILVTDLIFYTSKSKKEILKISTNKRKTEYQYHQLKGQLNPHFLFNSLNILDYLVQNNETQRASDFIKKLAGVYRYLLNKESFTLVTIKEEITFVKLYISLLQERFTQGLIVNIILPDSVINNPKIMIVPCGLQLLVENAIKHNIVSSSTPLTIEISCTDEYIIVTNNLQPKINSTESTMVGLNNITAQYIDIANKTVIITKTETEFIVKLPICSINNSE
jgi:Putative regulator of cell autolysis